MVPLNSWPMVMGRDSLVTGCGVIGENLESHGQWHVRMALRKVGEKGAYLGPAKYSCRSGWVLLVTSVRVRCG